MLMRPLQVFPSTTSHKHEPILLTLEIFARLGMHDLDLNLNHIVDRGAEPQEVKDALASNGQHVHIVSGGWCDFFDDEPGSRETLASVERQVELARLFDVDRIRLFFGRLPIEACSPVAVATAAANIRRLAERHPQLLFVFENHGGASSSPEVCRAILEQADRPNAALTFDPINFEAAGIDSYAALETLRHLVGHVHLKGIDYDGGFCEFGSGRVDLTPALRALIAGGYRGGFSVEYEGPRDRTLRLYEGLRSARAAIRDLVAAAPAP